MLFGLFKKNTTRKINFTDLVFVSEAAKEAAVITLARQHPDLVFIAWFADTAAHFKQLFTTCSIDESRVEEAVHYTAGKYRERKIVFLEHHPLRDKEEKFVQNCMQQEFTVYNSLTEPLFIRFGGDRLILLMKKFGVSEDEPLQHKLISKSLKNAQQKIAKKVTVERMADSQEKWMQRNIEGGLK